MIGIIFDEGYTTLEFWPIYGSEKGIPKYAKFSWKSNNIAFGEYGIAFSKRAVWIAKADITQLWTWKRFKRLFR